MRRAFLVVLFLGILASVCSAHEKKCVVKDTPIVVNNYTENTYVQADKNTLDYGAYLDLIVLETASTEWGFKVTTLMESSETRGYFGGKVYINRLFKK